MAGLELYRWENGAYPESLGQLVPAALPELPQDPFSGEDFRYDLTDAGYALRTDTVSISDGTREIVWSAADGPVVRPR